MMFTQWMVGVHISCNTVTFIIHYKPYARTSHEVFPISQNQLYFMVKNAYENIP